MQRSTQQKEKPKPGVHVERKEERQGGGKKNKTIEKIHVFQILKKKLKTYVLFKPS